MDFGKAYTFIKDQDNWIMKIVIAGLCSMFSWLILPYFLLIGYQVGVMQNVMKDEDQPLPEWTNIGAMFMDGVYIGVATIVYALPIILFLCIGSIVGLATGGFENPGTVSIVAWSCLGILMVIYGIALAFIIPAIFIQYSRTGDFGSLLRYRDVFAIARENLVDILLTFLAAWAANLVLGLVTVILVITVCGPIIASVLGGAWISIATAHLYGQIAAKTEGKAADVEFKAG